MVWKEGSPCLCTGIQLFSGLLIQVLEASRIHTGLCSLGCYRPLRPPLTVVLGLAAMSLTTAREALLTGTLLLSEPVEFFSLESTF